MNLSIGTFTPPFGINIFVGQAVFRAPLSAIYPGLAPFVVAAGAQLIRSREGAIGPHFPAFSGVT
jgi:TRAP-type C4-dicarboxylate transport system permease large subunit